MVKDYLKRGWPAIAVVGIACRFPDADDYNSFWCNLLAGKNSVKRISPQRRALGGLKKQTLNPDYCAAIEGIELFDHDFFSLSRREVETMDPQQRLVLEEAYHCIEDAGVAMDTLRRRITSVYLGITGSDYSLLALNRYGDVDSHAALGNMESLAANRISHLFGFHGISLSLDAATASSLVAVHEAKKSLCLRESDFALVAAVNLAFHPWRYITFDKAGMLSADGQCKAFDSHANGFVYGDGVAVLLLQRVEDALRDGNHVYGIIRGSSVNHCGNSHTITAPSVSAQREVVLAAWQEAGFGLETAGYMEAHGSGTALGDPVEIEALKQAFARHTSRQGFCKIGSVKSNIGHLFSAAGLAGLIKVVLMMRHGRVPKTLNIEQPNPMIDFAASPFLPALETDEWISSKDNSIRRAGVSAIGIGGVNAHVVLEECRCESGVTTAVIPKTSRDSLPFILSAKTPAALRAMKDRWNTFVTTEEFNKASFSDICLTLAIGRETLPYRAGFCLKGKSDLVRMIERIGGENIVTAAKCWNLHLTGLTPTEAHSVARSGLRHELFRGYFKDIARAVGDVDPSVAMWEQDEETVPSVVFAFVVECACARVLIALGMNPQQMSASGAGLWAALSVCGILSWFDAAALLSNKRQWRDVNLHRPETIPFYDPVGRSLVMPLRFDAAYLAALIYEVRVSSELVSELVEKAQLLIGSQFTFNQHLGQWRRELKPAGLDLDAMLRDWTPKHKHYQFTSHGSLLALVIASTLCKLSRRWDLSDPLLQDDTSFREIVQLLADDVMQPIALVDLFTCGNDAIERVAETLNQRHADMTLSRSYKRLHQHCQMVDDIGEPESWFQRALGNTEVSTTASGAARLEFGARTWLRHDGELDEVFDMARQPPDAGFIPLLVGLWRHGVNLEWGKLYAEGSFHKVSLPGYPFQRQAHWLALPVSATEDEHDCVSTDVCLSYLEMQHSMHASKSSINAQSYLRELFARELRIPSSELDEDKPFSELGVTSLMVAALVKHIEVWLEEKFDPSAILEYPTISRLSAYLTTHHAGRATRQGHATPDPRGAGVGQVAGIHNSEVQPIENPPAANAGQAEAAGVAVIGIGCQFPEAQDKNQFWNNLVAGRNSIVEVSELRWDILRHYSATGERHKSISKWGGFIQGIEYFDPEYFGLKADVAPHFDPLIRQFLESAVQTFADAGYDKSALAGQRVGVFVGSRVSNYRNRIDSLLPETVLGVDQNFIASHVSHLFDLRGPNIVLDSACSSSLISIHTACRSLMTGDCEMALAGGVDILLDESQYLMLSECQALSPDGRCFTFDERANGFVPGEGSGAVLLKPLASAIRDGDTIYAVVNGSAANNDGRTMGVTTPNPDAQRDVIARALRQAGVSAADISYIEAHGTGTMIGDPIELRALTEVFREVTDDRQFCGVGSVKTNIGHLLCAAGVAGFIKVVLSLYHKKLPPTLNCECPNPRFDFESSPFYPNVRLSEWHPRSGLRRAGISSFGFAGTNVHTVLSEFDPMCYSQPYQHRRHALPLVQFNKRRFWIDRDHGYSADSHVFGEAERDYKYSGVKPFMELVDETL